MANSEVAENVHSAEAIVGSKRRTVVANHFCKTCQTLLSGITQYSQQIRHGVHERQSGLKMMRFRNRHQMSYTARQGCHLCNIICADFEQGYMNETSVKDIAQDVASFLTSLTPPTRPDEAKVIVAIRLHQLNATSSDLDILLLEICNDVPEPSLTAMSYLVLESQDEPNLCSVDLSIWTGSDQCLDLANGWFRDCISNHTDCYEDPDRDFQGPSRLLDLGPADGSLDVVLHEFDNDTPREKLHYVALSYCWGDVEALRLTKMTHAAFLRGIDWNSIPPTFQDAIIVTRRLSCQYLWIDSLCIIQNHPADKEREIPRMGDIYRYATCTIAALDAINPHAGIFSFRNPLIRRPIAFDTLNGEAFLIGRSRVEVDLDQFFEHHTTHSTSQTSLPLLRRGWVFQERYLSQRTLAYSSSTVSWHCSVCRCSEDYSKPQIPLSDVPIFHRWFTSASPDFDEQWRSRTFIHSWHNIVAAYTNCNMTFNTDRIPGITGLLDFVRRKTKLDITFGMWHRWMIEELMWIPERPGKRLQNDAPTWSWMSSASPIQWVYLHPPLSDVHFVAEVFSIEGRNSNQGHKRLTLRAYIEKSNSQGHGFLDPTLDIEAEDLRPVWLLLVYFRTNPKWSREKDDVETLLELSGAGDTEVAADPVEAFGLLVQPVTSSQIEYHSEEHTSWTFDDQTEWERVGVFHSRPCNTSELWPSFSVSEESRRLINLI